MKGWVKILIVFVVLLIIIIGAGAAWYFFYYQPPFPAELQKATFIGFDQSNKTVGYQYSPKGFVEVSVPGQTTSITTTKNGYVTLVQQGNLTQIQFNGHTLGSLTSAGNISISPNGRWVGFTLANNTATTSFPAIRELSATPTDPRWQADLIDTSGKKIALESLGAGVSPVFTDASHVVWLSPRGIMVMDLSSGKQALLAQVPMHNIFGPVLVSPDGKHIAFSNNAKRTEDIYSVTPTAATLLAQIPFDKDKPATSFALGNSMLYSIYGTKTNTEIYAAPLAGGKLELAGTIPNSRISRMILPSSL